MTVSWSLLGCFDITLLTRQANCAVGLQVIYFFSSSHTVVIAANLDLFIPSNQCYCLLQYVECVIPHVPGDVSQKAFVITGCFLQQPSEAEYTTLHVFLLFNSSPYIA